MKWPTDVTFAPTPKTDVVTSEPSTEFITDVSDIDDRLFFGIIIGFIIAYFVSDVL